MTGGAWETAREARYAQGHTYAGGMVRTYGIEHASRAAIAATKAGDLCTDTARGALDALLYYATERS